MLSAILGCAQALFVQTGWTESADRDKPINLEADQVLLDDTQQISTFTGKVSLTQGTLMIRGDKIIVEQGKDGFKRAVAFGNTAEFRQKQEGLDKYAEGYGERIEYDTRTGILDIFGQSRLKRGQDEVRGERISYNTRTEVFQVNGSNSVNGVPPQRVRAILQPKPNGEQASSMPAGNNDPLPLQKKP